MSPPFFVFVGAGNGLKKRSDVRELGWDALSLLGGG
jgi:hypothetical protein